MWGCTAQLEMLQPSRGAGNGLICAGVTGQMSNILLTCTSHTGRLGSHSTHRARAMFEVGLAVARVGLPAKVVFHLAADFFISNTAPFHAMRVGLHL